MNLNTKQAHHQVRQKQAPKRQVLSKCDCEPCGIYAFTYSRKLSSTHRCIWPLLRMMFPVWRQKIRWSAAIFCFILFATHKLSIFLKHKTHSVIAVTNIWVTSKNPNNLKMTIPIRKIVIFRANLDSNLKSASNKAKQTKISSTFLTASVNKPYFEQDLL